MRQHDLARAESRRACARPRGCRPCRSGIPPRRRRSSGCRSCRARARVRARPRRRADRSGVTMRTKPCTSSARHCERSFMARTVASAHFAADRGGDQEGVRLDALEMLGADRVGDALDRQDALVDVRGRILEPHQRGARRIEGEDVDARRGERLRDVRVLRRAARDRRDPESRRGARRAPRSCSRRRPRSACPPPRRSCPWCSCRP